MTIKGLIQLMLTLLAMIAVLVMLSDAQNQHPRQSDPTPANKPWHYTTPDEDRQWQLDRLTECMHDHRLCDNETP